MARAKNVEEVQDEKVPNEAGMLPPDDQPLSNAQRPMQRKTVRATREQLRVLQAGYHDCGSEKVLGADELAKLSSKTGLTSQWIKFWFERTKKKDLRAETATQVKEGPEEPSRPQPSTKRNAATKQVNKREAMTELQVDDVPFMPTRNKRRRLALDQPSTTPTALYPDKGIPNIANSTSGLPTAASVSVPHKSISSLTSVSRPQISYARNLLAVHSQPPYPSGRTVPNISSFSASNKSISSSTSVSSQPRPMPQTTVPRKYPALQLPKSFVPPSIHPNATFSLAPSRAPQQHLDPFSHLFTSVSHWHQSFLAQAHQNALPISPNTLPPVVSQSSGQQQYINQKNPPTGPGFFSARLSPLPVKISLKPAFHEPVPAPSASCANAVLHSSINQTASDHMVESSTNGDPPSIDLQPFSHKQRNHSNSLISSSQLRTTKHHLEDNDRTSTSFRPAVEDQFLIRNRLNPNTPATNTVRENDWSECPRDPSMFYSETTVFKCLADRERGTRMTEDEMFEYLLDENLAQRDPFQAAMGLVFMSRRGLEWDYT